MLLPCRQAWTCPARLWGGRTVCPWPLPRPEHFLGPFRDAAPLDLGEGPGVVIVANQTIAFWVVVRQIPFPAVLSTADHSAILYFKCMFTIDAIIYDVRIGLPPPDTCWKRTAIHMARETPVKRLSDSSFGKNQAAALFCNSIMNPSLVGTGLDYQFFQILPGKLARRC